MSVSKKPGKTLVLYHYYGLSRFFWNRRYLNLLQFPNSKKNSFRGNYMRKYGNFHSRLSVLLYFVIFGSTCPFISSFKNCIFKVRHLGPTAYTTSSCLLPTSNQNSKGFDQICDCRFIYHHCNCLFENRSTRLYQIKLLALKFRFTFFFFNKFSTLPGKLALNLKTESPRTEM